MKKDKKEDEKDEEKSTFRSKRVYPEKQCFNPGCDEKFEPHDRRQKFHNTQCRINYHNDQRNTDNNTKFKNERYLREYDKKLRKIYVRYVDDKGYCVVSLEILNYERIDVGLLVQQQESKITKGTVRWFYQFGTELHPTNKEYFIIHKKSIK